jgi:phosphatidylserine/phosphatidylglycerophosphate/cardiolipin synthase-like enzyme
MRFKDGNQKFKVYAVTGTNTIAFGIKCDDADMKGLLGFTVEKEYQKDGQTIRITVMGFKVFKERIENPVPGALYSTYDNPIQSFVWEDFSAYPNQTYTYHFTPLYKSPLNILRGETFSIKVGTEPDWKAGDHSIFFNRGVASSQAYAFKFGNKNPDEFEDDRAYKWLSRGLKEAIMNFINQAQNGDEIYGCFYEFRNDEILNCFRAAVDRGVKLHIIYDAKENEHIDSETNKVIESFPKVENEKALRNAGLDDVRVKLKPRKRNKSYISHNKFMILIQNGVPKKVWTGSTNISKGGIFGQANVGHSIENMEVAKKYKAYWDKLKDDPESKTIKETNIGIQDEFTSIDDIKNGVYCFFSPRKSLDILKLYSEILDSAKDCACITFAFGVHKYFEEALSDNDTRNALTFILLEKDDPDISDYIYKNNVVKAVGSFINDDATFKWVKETNTKYLGLNTWVMFVHTKFLLVDPLSDKPIVVTGSANFSEASTEKNDENMMIIKGETRVADIYFTELLRIFNHYYFRWIVKKTHGQGNIPDDNPAFLKSDDSWTEQYKAGKFKNKKIQIFSNIKGATTLPIA